MFTLRSTKPAKRILGGVVVFALIVIAAFAIKSARAFRNRSQLGADNRTSSQKAAEAFARPTSTQSSYASDKPTVEELGTVPSTLDSRYWLFFVDEQNGWFADFQKLWWSSDGGRNWKLLFSHKDDTFDIFFSNLQVGWMERASGTYRTEDGGANWIKVLTPIEYPKGMNAGMYFLNDGQIGWLAGGLYKPVSLKRFLEESPASYLVRGSTEDGGNAFLYQSILKTTDGGKTWRKQSLPDEVGEIFSLNFADDKRGVALGGSDIFFTKNGGKQWSPAVLKPECVDPDFIKFPDSRPRAVAFAEPSLAWVSYDNGRVLKSTDGAENWCDLLRPEEVWHRGEHDAYFQKLYFNSPTRGWGLKANGTLHKTEDGGRTWTPLDLSGAKVWEIQFFKDHALLVTRDKLLRITF